MFCPKVGWVITDKLGRYDQFCLDIFEQLKVVPHIIRLQPCWPLAWVPEALMGLFPARRTSRINPPWPDMILVGSHHVIPYVRSIKEQVCDYCFVGIPSNPFRLYKEFDFALLPTELTKQKPFGAFCAHRSIKFSPELVKSTAQRLLKRYANFVEGL